MALLLPDKDSDPVSEDLARDLAAHYGVTPILESITPAPGGLRLLRAPRRGHRPRVPRVRRRGRLQGQDRPALRPAGGRHAQRLLPDDRHAGRRGEERPPGPGGVRADRGGLQLQAAQPDEHALLPRRAAELRRGRHAQQERARPGVLRQVRRRGLRPRADRAPLQDPGLPAGRPPGRARGHPDAHPHDRHLQRPVHPGGVLLPPPLRDHGPALVRAGERGLGGGDRARALDMSADQVRNAFADFTRKGRTTHYLRAAPLDMAGLGAPVPEAD